VKGAQEVFEVSERGVCRTSGQPRSTQRHVGRQPGDIETLTLRLVELANQYVAMATGASQLCCSMKAGGNACGAGKG
jgi:hypothetical protein